MRRARGMIYFWTMAISRGANTLKTSAYGIWGFKLGFDNGGPITAYIEGWNLSDEAYIASTGIIDRANKNSPLFEPGTGRAVYAGVQVKW